MVKEFASELLHALATVEAIDHVALHSEGPIVNGRAYLTLGADQFLEFYFNEKTGTIFEDGICIRWRIRQSM